MEEQIKQILMASMEMMNGLFGRLERTPETLKKVKMIEQTSKKLMRLAAVTEKSDIEAMNEICRSSYEFFRLVNRLNGGRDRLN